MTRHPTRNKQMHNRTQHNKLISHPTSKTRMHNRMQHNKLIRHPTINNRMQNRALQHPARHKQIQRNPLRLPRLSTWMLGKLPRRHGCSWPRIRRRIPQIRPSTKNGADAKMLQRRIAKSGLLTRWLAKLFARLTKKLGRMQGMPMERPAKLLDELTKKLGRMQGMPMKRHAKLLDDRTRKLVKHTKLIRHPTRNKQMHNRTQHNKLISHPTRKTRMHNRMQHNKLIRHPTINNRMQNRAS